MKLMHLNRDATVRLENARITQRMVEFPDGYHPMTNDSVWQDAMRKRPPVIVSIDGVLPFYGGSMTGEDILHELYNVELSERAMKRQSVSKMNWRFLGQIFDGLMKYGVVLFIASLVAWALYMSLTGGAA